MPDPPPTVLLWIPEWSHALRRWWPLGFVLLCRMAATDRRRIRLTLQWVYLYHVLERAELVMLERCVEGILVPFTTTHRPWPGAVPDPSRWHELLAPITTEGGTWTHWSVSAFPDGHEQLLFARLRDSGVPTEVCRVGEDLS